MGHKISSRVSQMFISNIYVEAHKALPCYILWGLWLSRNKMFFQGNEITFDMVSHHTRLSYGGYFDGTCQGNPCMCKACAFL